MAIVTRIRITSLGMVIRFEIPKKIGIEPGLTFSAFGETLTMFVVATIIFDFLLIYGRVTLVVMHRRILTHYKIILSGKETVKYNIKEESKWIKVIIQIKNHCDMTLTVFDLCKTNLIIKLIL